MVVTHQAFFFYLLQSSTCTTKRPFLTLPVAYEQGCAGAWEGTQPGQVTQIDQRDVLCLRMSCSMIKTAGWPFQSSYCLEAVWALRCWWEGGRDCLCFTCVFLSYFFPLVFKLALSQPMSFFLLLWFKFSPPCLEALWMGGWWAL